MCAVRHKNINRTAARFTGFPQSNACSFGRHYFRAGIIRLDRCGPFGKTAKYFPQFILGADLAVLTSSSGAGSRNPRNTSVSR